MLLQTSCETDESEDESTHQECTCRCADKGKGTQDNIFEGAYFCCSLLLISTLPHRPCDDKIIVSHHYDSMYDMCGIC